MLPLSFTPITPLPATVNFSDLSGQIKNEDYQKESLVLEAKRERAKEFAGGLFCSLPPQTSRMPD